MANNIVQHRRGALEDWLNLDLTPYEGEIIIVELGNGKSACKIGDGISTFSKLPYLTDELKKDLIDKITNLQISVEQQHELFINNFNTKLNAIETRLDTDIISETALLKTELVNSDIETLQEAKKYSDINISVVNNEVAKILEDLTALKNDLANTQEQINESISNNFVQIDASLAKAFSKYELTFTEKLNNLKDDFNNKLTLSNSAAEASIQELSGKISNLELYLEQTIRPEIVNADQKLSTKIESVENSLLASLDTVEAKNEQFNSNLKKTLVVDLQELKQQVVALELFANQAQDNTTKSLDELNKQIVDLIDDYLEQLSLIYETKNYCTVEISLLRNFLLEKDLVQINDINDLKYRLTDLEERSAIVNNDIINNIASQIEAISTELARVNQLNLSVLDSLSTTEESLQESLDELRTENSRAIREVKKELTELEATALSTHESLIKDILSIETQIKSLTDELNLRFDSTDAKILDINTNINKLENHLSAQNTRISNILALKEGSTTGDIELSDIRIDHNGNMYDSAGDAVRAVSEGLEELKENLPDYIPDNAVDGLLYDNNLLYLTSDGVPVCEPVEIKGGSGSGGGGSTVKIKNNLLSTALTIAKDTEAKINFTYTSFEDSLATGDGTATIVINDKLIDELVCTVQHNVAKELEISKYLKNGSNTVKVTCTDQYGSSRSLVYTISVIELKIESTFKATNIYSSEITFRFKVFGAIEKIVHILIDDKEVYNQALGKTVSGSEFTTAFPKQPHGCHKLKAYVSANIGSTEISSNILEYDLICAEENNSTAMIASTYNIKEVTQGDLISIPFIVYDPEKLESSVDLIIYSQIAGSRVTISKTSLIVGRTEQYWQTRKYPAGKCIFEISYTYNYNGTTKTITKSHELTVKALDIDIEAETDSLQLFLSAQDRANTEIDPATWTYTPKSLAGTALATITTSFENFNWKSNGWVVDNNGDTCLRLTGDAKAVINFKPFQEDFKINGKTLEFEFAVRNVNKRDTVVIDCFNGERGFMATPDTAFLQSSGAKVSCRYKDEERIRVAVSVEHADSQSRFVSIYVDGILSGVQRYATTDSFSQQNPVNITLGSSFCDLDIYSIRIYNKALSTPQMLNNYIADMAEPTMKQKLYTENDILDENGKISYERVKALGQIPIITFTGPMPTYKGDKKKKLTRMKFEDPVNPEMNFDVLLDQIDVQGTSSQFYVRKNWKVKLPEARAHMPGAIPAKVFCIKVDYAEATGTHNTGSANYIETLYDRNEAILPPQKDDPRIRTTIQGFPCILFEKTSEDSEPVFSSKGNFNYDKDAEDTFGFSDAYEDFGVECWEFCNNTSDSVNFAGEVPHNWLEDFEPRYHPGTYGAKNDPIYEVIEELQKKADAGTITEAEQQELDTLLDTCIANFKKMHDWVVSTAPYEIVNGEKVALVEKPLLEPVTYGSTTYTIDNTTYRLAKFKHEFSNYFNMHYSCIYYVFTFFALMTDQRAKNMFLTRWKDDDGIYRWYPYFYDNDTIFGINNEGALVFDYYHEDIDKLGSSNVYNGQNSVLWNNFRECFVQEIQDTYANLRNNKKLTYEAITEQFITNGSDKWSAAIYNEDAEYKYISMARPSGPDNTVDASNLYQVRGTGEQHLRYFVDNRLDYCDSKWNAGDYPSDFYFLRIYTPSTIIPLDTPEEDLVNFSEEQVRIYKSLKAVPANPNITVTPFSNMYAGVKYKANGTLQQQRLAAGQVHVFEPVNENETFNDTETAIYGASNLESLGDLSGLYCGVVNLAGKNTGATGGTVENTVAQGKVKENKLVRLKIGNANSDYYNDNFREIAVGTCKLLREIDLRNCSGLGKAGKNPQKTLDLTQCPNIETIYTEGTNLDLVDLPESGYVKILHLPASTTVINIKNQLYIEDFLVESFKNVKTLCIDNCPTLNTNEILEQCKDGEQYTVERVRLTGIDWYISDVSFLKSLYPKFDTEGNLVGGIRGIDANNQDTDDAFLVGTCTIDTISGADFAEVKEHYPFLEVKYNNLTSKVSFYNLDNTPIIVNGEELSYEVSGGMITDTNRRECPDPVETGVLPTPTRESTAEFDFEFSGWTRLIDDEAHADALYGIEGNRILYPAFKKHRRSYTVNFYNPAKKGNILLKTLVIPYGSPAELDGSLYEKQDTTVPEKYAFVGWLPEPSYITGNLDCFAQFSLLDDAYYTPTPADFEISTDISDGVVIINYNNKLNKVVRIPSNFTINGEVVDTKTVGGFSKNPLEIIKIESPTRIIASQCFNACQNLLVVELPESLESIGEKSFASCTALTSIFIPKNVKYIAPKAFSESSNIVSFEINPENTTYEVDGQCIMRISDKYLIAGNKNSIIPKDTKKIAHSAFYGSLIKEAEIPEGLQVLEGWAFARCSELTSLTLPRNLPVIGDTCFAWCTKLNAVRLPDNLKDLNTYLFAQCPIEEFDFPSTLGVGDEFTNQSKYAINDHAISSNKNLRVVTFKPILGGDYSNFRIHEKAFIGSGHSDGVTFNVPWKEGQVAGFPWSCGIDEGTGEAFTEVKINYEYKEA